MNMMLTRCPDRCPHLSCSFATTSELILWMDVRCMCLTSIRRSCRIIGQPGVASIVRRDRQRLYYMVKTSLQASETKRFSAAGDYTCVTVHLLHSRTRVHCVRRPSTCSTHAATEARRPLAFPFGHFPLLLLGFHLRSFRLPASSPLRELAPPATS
jgi:hypothetical protein